MFHIIIYIIAFGCVTALPVLESRFVAEVDIPDLVLRLDANDVKLNALTKNLTETVGQLGSLTRSFNDLKAKVDHQPVAFKAHLASSGNLFVTIGPNQRIIFDDVQLNLGNAYFQHLGGFLAPLSGTYMFSVSICSHEGHYIVLNLMKNNNRIGGVLAGDDALDDCSSETTVTQLNAGDQVYVQHHGTDGDMIFVHQNYINSFTGSLLQIL
ncbi:heavy metal-binding protein HIP-like [Dreissena polymorpha]|uniref:heavy metal-binding protein HIP-like n=1 Tax=Dreissena polymorpha TaxID=45954 RepID=UPI00226491AC|nr:heavy metal-binding protein HIP-like [Dreissena polymorpha]